MFPEKINTETIFYAFVFLCSIWETFRQFWYFSSYVWEYKMSMRPKKQANVNFNTNGMLPRHCTLHWNVYPKLWSHGTSTCMIIFSIANQFNVVKQIHLK